MGPHPLIDLRRIALCPERHGRVNDEDKQAKAELVDLMQKVLESPPPFFFWSRS